MIARVALALLLLLLSSSAEAQWYPRPHHRDGGAVVGGIVGGVISRLIWHDVFQPAYTPEQMVAWCAQRFRSYNPQTGFYLGYDGQYHRCP